MSGLFGIAWQGNRRMKVLIVGFNCSPVRGSEFSFTWRWAWHLARQHQVWVLTSKFGWQEVEEYLQHHSEPTLRFERVDAPRWLDPEFHGLSAGPYYLVWQRRILRRAEELHRQVGFDVVHHVGWGTVSAPSPLWKLPAPFVWGPVGGGQLTPASLQELFGRRSGMESIRRWRLAVASRRASLRQTAQNSSLILVTNRESENVLRRAGAKRIEPFLDSGIPPEFMSPEPFRRSRRGDVTVLWAGKFEPRKALPLALHAFKRVRAPRVSLTVAGDGPCNTEWRRLAADLNLGERVRFVGNVPWSEMFELYRRSDLFLFTSLRDSFGTQVLEACSQALPIVTLDHQGVGTFLPDAAGIKVPVSSVEATSQALAEAIDTLASSLDLRTRMGLAGWSFARNETWDVRARRMSARYEELVGTRETATAPSLAT
jgi:glycosyltransferase involved in cell wall biosynthesis